MFQLSSSYKGKGKKKIPRNPPSPFSIPCQSNSHPDHPPEVLSLILEKRFHKKAMNMMLSYQLSIFQDFGRLFLKPLGLHPEYPFIHPLKFQFEEFPEELKWIAWIHKTHFLEVSLNPYDYKDLQKYLCQINKIIPSEIWPLGKTLAPWDYPMYCNQATQDTPAWKDVVEDILKWKDVYEMTPPDDLEQRIEQLELKCYRAREEKKRKVEELNLTSDVSTDYDSD
ncbi:hypothetical protein Goshw_009605 [Gossypium schwendimanii]|uniref:Uncharacterized protein n=1 Tax=Gossypium schwendimanii TaxID=34291 RepID=A0A7J9LV14_GOSSC|nr:hypothetical protein [Gossypium schwendimanii]